MKTFRVYFILLMVLFSLSVCALMAAPARVTVVTPGLRSYRVHVHSYQIYFYKSNCAVRDTSFNVEQGSFSVSLPYDRGIGFLTINLEPAPDQFVNVLMDLMLVAGEHLSVRREMDGQLFYTGSAAATAAVQARVSHVRGFERAGPGRQFSNVVDRMERMNFVVDSLAQEKAGIITGARDSLSAVQQSALLSEIGWQAYYRKLEYLLYLLQSSADRHLLDWYANHLRPLQSSPSSTFIPRYSALAIITRAKIEQVDLPTVFRKLASLPRGELRERVLTQLAILDFNRHDSMGNLLASILPSITTPLYRKELTTLAHRAPGAAAFNFALVDTAGRTVRLSEFKGKYVLMDFWFWGCGACRILADSLRALMPALVGQPIALVSVNIDTRREAWLQHKDKYAPHGAIELNCNFKGADCDLIKYYDFLAYPQLVLIDPVGRILAVDPDLDPNLSAFTEIKRLLIKRLELSLYAAAAASH